MQIWKSPYMFVFIKTIWKSENFGFLTLRIPEFFAREVCKFFRK